MFDSEELSDVVLRLFVDKVSLSQIGEACPLPAKGRKSKKSKKGQAERDLPRVGPILFSPCSDPLPVLLLEGGLPADGAILGPAA